MHKVCHGRSEWFHDVRLTDFLPELVPSPEAGAAVAGHAQSVVPSMGKSLVCRACEHHIEESSSSAACPTPA